MARVCPLCDEAYKGLLAEHVLEKHGQVLAMCGPNGRYYTGMRCFCGYGCMGYATMSYHWRLDGGLAQHIMRSKL